MWDIDEEVLVTFYCNIPSYIFKLNLRVFPVLPMYILQIVSHVMIIVLLGRAWYEGFYFWIPKTPVLAVSITDSLTFICNMLPKKHQTNSLSALRKTMSCMAPLREVRL